MNNTCDTCKWWDTEYSPPDNLHKSDRFYHDLGMKECLSPKFNDSDEPDGFAIDGCEMGNSPFVVTGPKFGCCHHEFTLAKPGPSTSE